MSSSITIPSDSSSDEASDSEPSELEAASVLLVAEEIAPNILKDRLIARLTSHTSSVLDIKKVYVSDLMTAFHDKTLHQQLPNYLRQALTNVLTPHVATTGPNALKSICKYLLLYFSLLCFRSL